MILSVHSRVRGMFHSPEQWRLLGKNKKQVCEGRTAEIGLIIYNDQLLILWKLQDVGQNVFLLV